MPELGVGVFGAGCGSDVGVGVAVGEAVGVGVRMIGRTAAARWGRGWAATVGVGVAVGCSAAAAPAWGGVLSRCTCTTGLWSDCWATCTTAVGPLFVATLICIAAAGGTRTRNRARGKNSKPLYIYSSILYLLRSFVKGESRFVVDKAGVDCAYMVDTRICQSCSSSFTAWNTTTICDPCRTKNLAKCGYRTLRLPEGEINNGEFKHKLEAAMGRGNIL